MVEKDVIVIGVGAAGLMCAIEAGKRGRRVAVLEQASQIGKKILISGGGRCNFTNLKVTSQNYLSQNEHFCKSALSRYSSSSFVALVEKHQIAYHEKKLGQLFCDVSAKDIVAMLKAECDQAKVQILTEQSVAALDKAENFIVKTQNQTYTAASVVIASGGLTVPKISSDIGYRVAKQYGLKIVNCRPALVPLTLSEEKRKKFAELSGISVDALVSCQDKTFRENILVTHWGLSGPAILQISSYWQNPDPIVIDLCPTLIF